MGILCWRTQVASKLAPTKSMVFAANAPGFARGILCPPGLFRRRLVRAEIGTELHR